MNDDDYLTTKEAAQIVGCSPANIKYLAARGRFPGAYKVGLKEEWRIPPGSVHQWLEDRQIRKTKARGRRMGLNTRLAFRFILEYKRNNDGNSPSVREIGKGIGVNSTSQIHYYLSTLEIYGYINLPQSREAKAISVNGGSWEYIGEDI